VPALVVCFPIGLIGLWKRPATTTMVKGLVTAGTALVLVFGAFAPDDTTDSGDSSTTAPSADPSTSQTPTGSAPSESTDIEPTPPVVPPAKVPATRGLTIKLAKQEIRRAGFILGEIERQMSAKPAGTVLQQDIRGGTRLVAGSAVSLVVAIPFPRVPPVVGVARLAAVRRLRAAGYEVSLSTETRESGTSGVVLSQDPSGNKRIPPGTVVSLVILKVVIPHTSGGGGNCTPGYDPCLTPSSDYDCAGGSGNGPSYADGPIYVSGSDPYDLDYDGDGVACES
jgi:beta-lactam-binding protein with PASTA domain